MKYLRRFSLIAALLGLTAWVVGSAAFIFTAEFGMFQRMGALGVAAAFLFFSDQLSQIELGRQRSVEKLLHEFGLELAALKQGTKPQDMPQEGYAVDFLTEERNFGALRRRASRFEIANVTLLTIATLQWGFGDRWLQKLTCGEFSC